MCIARTRISSGTRLICSRKKPVASVILMKTRAACFLVLIAFHGKEKRWRCDGEKQENTVSKTVYGDRLIYGFGFLSGFQYASRTAPHDPFSQRNNELYPVALMKHQPLRDVFVQHTRSYAPFAMPSVECSTFSNGWVVVNHRSTPVSIPLAGMCMPASSVRQAICPPTSACGLRKNEHDSLFYSFAEKLVFLYIPADISAEAQLSFDVSIRGSQLHAPSCKSYKRQNGYAHKGAQTLISATSLCTA